LSSYLAYGAAVRAPADGLVVAVVDGLPDRVPGVIRYGPRYGNHVVLDTGTERVVLAHLQPGSTAVAPRHRVRAGQLRGRVGNSGNSSEPHLHLHLHAERAGRGVQLQFRGVFGHLYRGRHLDPRP
jgi:murein DD-endopeptidase MepM/ murein hydrolase activator NlpD